MPLPPAVKLTGHAKIKYQGSEESGPLMADDTGLGVDFTKRQGLKKITRRAYFVAWPEVTNIDIAQPQTMNLGGSTINANSVILTVDTAERHMAFTLKHTSMATVHNQLGKQIANLKTK